MSSTFVDQDISFSGKELFMFEVFNINQLLITNDYNRVFGTNAETTKRLIQIFIHFLGEQIKTKDDIQIKNARLFMKYIYNFIVLFIVGNGVDDFKYIDNDNLQNAIVNIHKIIDYIDAIDKYETINVNDIIEGYFYNKNLEDIIGFSLQTIEMSDEENTNADLEETLSNEENDINDDEQPLIEDDNDINENENDIYENENQLVDNDDEENPEPIELEIGN